MRPHRERCQAYIERIDEVVRGRRGRWPLRAARDPVDRGGGRSRHDSDLVGHSGGRSPRRSHLEAASSRRALARPWLDGRAGDLSPSGARDLELPAGRPAPAASVQAAHGPEAAAAAAMLSQGRPQGRGVVPDGVTGKEVSEDEPYAQMVLGTRAGQRAAQHSGAGRVCQKAVWLEPKLANDKLMRTNLALMLGQEGARRRRRLRSSSSVCWPRWRDDRRAADQLVDLASSSKDRAAAAQGHEPSRTRWASATEVDRLGSYLLDLEQGEELRLSRRGCRGEAARAGRQEGHPARCADARRRPRTEGGLIKRKVNTNACLRTDAAEAIRYFKSL